MLLNKEYGSTGYVLLYYLYLLEHDHDLTNL